MADVMAYRLRKKVRYFKVEHHFFFLYEILSYSVSLKKLQRNDLQVMFWFIRQITSFCKIHISACNNGIFKQLLASVGEVKVCLLLSCAGVISRDYMCL
jgi:hypothetical protein